MTFKFFFFSFVGFVLLHVILYSWAYFTPKINISSANNISIYDKDENVIFTGSNKNEWVNIENINKNLINATISVEDKNFYKHMGFDYARIIKAMLLNIKSAKIVQGASSITQQYARNLYLSMEKTWTRKINEAWITMELEMHYSKDEILEGYLNSINYGQGVYGIENASKYYFDKSAKDLNLAEASMLAGIPNSPSNYSPLIDEYNAKKRQKKVLQSMVDNGYITEKEMDEAFNTKLEYIGKKEKYNLQTLMYYQDAVTEELNNIDEIPKSLISTGGLKIYTALDIDAQTYLDEAVKSNTIENIDAQISGVVLNPDTGEVIALAGGTDYSKSEYNRAISSKRQVGSTMKPFLYYGALTNGFTSSTTFLSSPTTFTFDSDKTYSPKNYGERYAEKEISLASAIAFSDNIYAVKTHMFLGEETLVDIAKNVGIDEEMQPLPSLPLGTIEINLMDFVGAYASFANLGYKVEPHLIKKVLDKDGNVLYEAKNNKTKVLDSSNVFILNELLANTYSYDFVDYTTPTLLSISPKLKNKYAIKSGSTDTDSLTIGYNKDIALGIWYGYDDNKKLDTNDSKVSKNIWADTVNAYFDKNEAHWYDIPENVVSVLVNPITGQLATDEDKKKHVFYYIKGTEPTVDNLDYLIENFTGEKVTE